MKVPVLTYHAVLPVPRGSDVRGTVPAELFAEQVAWLARRGYRSVSLDRAAALLQDGEGDDAGRPVVLTFDDGYRCVLEHALPVLERHGFTATLFVVPSVVGRTTTWYVPKGGVPFEHATWDELAAAQQRGFDVGSHTLTHRRLTELPPGELQAELAGSKQQIADRLGRCEHLAYPFGAVSTAVEEAAARCGYRTACTTEGGMNRRGQSLTSLRRQTIGRHTGRWRFRHKLGVPW